MNKDFIRLNLIIFGLLVSLILFVAGVLARVESMPSRQAESERHPAHGGAGVEGLFESMLAEAFE